MKFLYNMLMYLAVPFILLRLYWRSRSAPQYRQRIAERFGFFPRPNFNDSIWVHAVSVGESVAAVPLVRHLRKLYPNKAIVMTTMTTTGSDRVRATLADEVFNVYVPYDLPGAVKRFLDNTNPSLLVVMETELWPNIFEQCHQRNIPVFVANARLSARSAAGYKRFGHFTKKMLSHITAMAAQTKADMQRFRTLGLHHHKIAITGSMKFDIQFPPSLLERAEALRQTWGSSRPIVIAASTHDGEEEQVLAAFSLVLKELPETLLVLVPRHPERFSRVANLCRKQGFETVMRTETHNFSAKSQVYIGDTMGELPLLYAASDVAYVGGSLVATGGHNMLEPAALAKPIVCGPHVFNFVEISQMLVKAGAMTVVQNAQQLADLLIDWLFDADKCQQIGEKGKQVVVRNRGAVESHLKLIEKILQSQ